jgi:hypothetical protein
MGRCKSKNNKKTKFYLVFLYIVHEVYKTFENNDFDPNNFNKLIKRYKSITIELKDKGFRILPFEQESDIGFDNYDFI